MIKGEKGLSDYSRLMHSISQVLKRNGYMIEQLALYHENISQINDVSKEVHKQITELKGK